MKLDYNRNALDVFRLIATIQIFLGHAITHFSMDNAPVNAVYFVRGVPILFVLCGFLAAKSLEGRSAREWLVGRAVRIFPAFWACILVNSLIILLVYEVKPTLVEAGVYAVTQFLGLNFYTGGWLRGYGCGTPNGVLWTIPVQLQFFLLCPLIYKLIGKRKLSTGLILVGALAAVSIGCNAASGFLPEIAGKLMGVTVIPYLYFLVAGMVGWYHRDTIIPALKKYKWLVLACYVLWKLAEIYFQLPHIFDGVLYNTVTTLLMAAVIFAFAFCGAFRMKTDLTFGFYLYHMVFINLALHFGFDSLQPAWLGVLLVAVITAAALMCAWLSLRFVEQPAAALKKKRG